MKLGYMACGNYGTVFHGLKHPRKDLLEKMGASSCQKMFVDSNEGAKHIGYIVRGEWFTVYEIHEWNGKKGA